MSAMRSATPITLVLVHSDDEPVTSEALDAVAQLNDTGLDVRMLVVDAGSPNTSQGWSGRPGVQAVDAFPGVGLAAARNRGAWRVTTPFVAFLDVSTRPGADWLTRSMAVLERDVGVTVVSPRFAGRWFPAPDYRGHQAHRPANAGVVEGAVLCPPSEAMVVRAEAFRALGGFDEDLERFGEDVDLGWRCNLLGHRVLGVDVEIVRVREPAVDPARRRFLEERNALRCVYKYYERSRVPVALTATMALAAASAVDAGPGAQESASAATAALVAALPALGPAREAIQAARLVADHELDHMFHPHDEPTGPFGGVEQAVAIALGVASAFSRRRRVLVLTMDVIAARMAGPAIRAWQIASALAAEHEVHLVTATDLCERSSPHFEVSAVGTERMAELEEWCDVMVVQGFALHHFPELARTRKVMVVDIYDPIHLEQLEQSRTEDAGLRRATVRLATEVLNQQLERGDYFICASPKQRDFWLGQMSAVGRINPVTYDADQNLGSLIGIVPFGLPDEPAVHQSPVMKGVIPGIGVDDEVILWGGGIYNWFDPLTLLRAIDLLRQRRPQVRLVFLGLRHPNPGVAEMRMSIETRRLADELELTGSHVFFNEGWVPYEDRQSYLLEADIGVSTHLDHLETAFSFRTRILDYIWAAVPIVATAGDSFAELIEGERLGITVPAGDVEALESALFRALDDVELHSLFRKNLAAVRPRFAWSTVLEPLVEFCRSPRRAPDLTDPHDRVIPPLHGPSSPRVTARGGLRQDIGIAVRHFRGGGASQVARKLGSRARHVLAGRA